MQRGRFAIAAVDVVQLQPGRRIRVVLIVLLAIDMVPLPIIIEPHGVGLALAVCALDQGLVGMANGIADEGRSVLAQNRRTAAAQTSKRRLVEQLVDSVLLDSGELRRILLGFRVHLAKRCLTEGAELLLAPLIPVAEEVG